jgi:hypothetical protein
MALSARPMASVRHRAQALRELESAMRVRAFVDRVQELAEDKRFGQH